LLEPDQAASNRRPVLPAGIPIVHRRTGGR
jgi:hypothetical protein